LHVNTNTVNNNNNNNNNICILNYINSIHVLLLSRVKEGPIGANKGGVSMKIRNR